MQHIYHKIQGGNMKVLMKQTNLYDEASRRYQELLQTKQIKENALMKAPPGKIHIIQTKNHTQFYLRKEKDEKTGEYISKSNTSQLKVYLQKSYDEKCLKLVEREIVVLEMLLNKSHAPFGSRKKVCSDHFKPALQQNHSINFESNSQQKHSVSFVTSLQQIYSNYPEEVKKYIDPIAMSDEDYTDYWINIPFVGKEISDYVPYYETNRKERVRSKSELNIANALAERGIPYKYECPLLLQNGSIIHPDFTILNRKARKEIYWEHRGMMDDKAYAGNSVLRLKTLMKNGIILGQNLIITEEAAASPLGTNEIETVIDIFING